MKILIVNRALGTLFGGGEAFDLNAARYLRERGHNVEIITGKPFFGEPKNRFDDFNVTYLSAPNFRRFAYSTESLIGRFSAIFYHLDSFVFEFIVFFWICRNKNKCFDVVQCCSLFFLPFVMLKWLDKPVVSWLPGPPSGLIRRRILALVKKKNFGLFTHGAPEWSLNSIGLIREKDYVIIEPGVELKYIEKILIDRAEVRRDLGVCQNALLGVTTARLVPVKNHNYLFDAIKLARNSGVEWEWIVIGDGPMEKKLKSYARDLGIDKHIHFLGYREKAEVNKYLVAADLFALTSTYENFSIATLEAMAHRLPIIGTQVGYLQHLITDAKAGVVVPVDEVESLSAALVKMSQPSDRKFYGESGRKFVECLDWPKIAEKIEKYYIEVALEGGR